MCVNPILSRALSDPKKIGRIKIFSWHRAWRGIQDALWRWLHLHANVARTDRRQKAMIVRENKGLALIAPDRARVEIAYSSLVSHVNTPGLRSRL